ncbi:hypothetical protein P3S67_025908 [Capsicum chacoense]
MGDFIEEGIKSGKIQSTVALPAASKAIKSDSINVQLREPITIQTYLPKLVVTTIAAKRPDFDTKIVPWDYRVESKGEIIDAAVAQGMTRSGRCYAPDEPNLGVFEKYQNPNRNITDVEAVEFWMNMQPKDYWVEEKINKTPSHISVMSFLMSSEAHRNSLMEVLFRVSIPKETTSETLAVAIG